MCRTSSPPDLSALPASPTPTYSLLLRWCSLCLAVTLCSSFCAGPGIASPSDPLSACSLFIEGVSRLDTALVRQTTCPVVMLTDLALWRAGDTAITPLWIRSDTLMASVRRLSGYVSRFGESCVTTARSGDAAWRAAEALSSRGWEDGFPVELIVLLERGDVLLLGLDFLEEERRWVVSWVDQSPVL
ncbi:hypothetical protein JW921_07475 [Candidatus Fermentibacterales bacterium]|nr:hypothetical protein [Candidatus Fermentibacterales bacterium]